MSRTINFDLSLKFSKKVKDDDHIMEISKRVVEAIKLYEQTNDNETSENPMTRISITPHFVPESIVEEINISDKTKS